MALAPHWLDDVIGTKRTVDDVAKAICNQPGFPGRCAASH